MLTSKFDFDAPTSREDVAEERAHLESILDDLFPEEQFKREVMVRLAESLFHCSNTHKYFVQLYGEGNNGKTTLLRILQTAFPQWVQMPSCFVDEGTCAPLGTVYVRKKIPNLEARYTQRRDKLALFAVLCDYYELYTRAGLPGLESRFSKPLSAIYREEHPSAKEVFERCVVEDPSASVPAKRLFSVMQENGYEDNHKALKLFLEEQYRNHAFVKVKRPKNKLTWSGLCVLDEYE